MIRWALGALDQHPELRRGEAPPNLLAPTEAQTLTSLKVPKRRQDWLIGRHTLKTMLVEHLRREHGQTVRPSDMEVRPAPDGAPEVWTEGRRLDFQVSITHSEGRAATAVSPHPSVSVGIDLETVASRSPRFVTDYFTSAEVEQVRLAPAAEREWLVTTIWSGKEAVLKSLRLGLTVSPRLVTCRPFRPSHTDDGWRPMQVDAAPEALTRAGATAPDTVLTGWWRPVDRQVLTLVTCAPSPSRC